MNLEYEPFLESLGNFCEVLVLKSGTVEQVSGGGLTMVDSGLWEGYHESRRCARDTYQKSYITTYTILVFGEKWLLFILY